MLAILAFLSGPALAGSGVKPDEKTPENVLKLFVEECVSISPGTDPFPKTFKMGGEHGGPFDTPLREVTMENPFRISKYEVTQELYQAVMGTNPSRWKGPRNSVEMVSFQDAQQFCTRLTALLQAKKLLNADEKVRLPTEAEWEYCCRAATSTRYSFGDSATSETDRDNQATLLNEYAWHTGNAAGNDPVVGSLKPNPWGLYDVHGYLWEFVSDPYEKSEPDPALKNPLDDSTAPVNEAARVIRGGSWRDHHSLLSSDARLALPGHAASDAIGFRCVISE